MDEKHEPMMSTRLALGVGLPACILALAIMPFATGRDRLPARIATHWTFSGQANGNMSLSTIRTVVILVATVSCLVLVAGAFSRKTADSQFSVVVALAGFAGAFVALLGWSTVKQNLDNNDWRVVAGPPGWHLATIILGSFAVGAFSGVTSSRLALPGVTAAPPVDSVAPSWSRSLSNPWFVGLAASLAVAGVSIMAIHPSVAGVPFLVVGVLLFPFSTIRVDINAGGLSVVFGHLVWPRRHIGFDTMASAEAIRKGDAIAVTLQNGKRFAVTIDEAAQGVAVLNALLSERVSEQPRDAAAPPTPD